MEYVGIRKDSYKIPLYMIKYIFIPTFKTTPIN